VRDEPKKIYAAKPTSLEFILQYKKGHRSSEAWFPIYGLLNINPIAAVYICPTVHDHSMQLLNLPHGFKIPYHFTATCINIHMTRLVGASIGGEQ
jgi:hypothetical protein